MAPGKVQNAATLVTPVIFTPVRNYLQSNLGQVARANEEVTNAMTTSAEKGGHPAMQTPPVVSPQAWEEARQQLLVKEKAQTRARDALAAERRRMPWMAVEKAYTFDGSEGRASLTDLFAGRRQLIVYRAFFEPGVFGWPDHGCRGCSMVADQVAHVAHLNARDTTLVFVSRAPQADIARLKARMGWDDTVVHHHRRF